jgi:hypothetical protein
MSRVERASCSARGVSSRGSMRLCSLASAAPRLGAPYEVSHSEDEPGTLRPASRCGRSLCVCGGHVGSFRLWTGSLRCCRLGSRHQWAETPIPTRNRRQSRWVAWAGSSRTGWVLAPMAPALNRRILGGMAFAVLRQDEHSVGAAPDRSRGVIVVGYDGSPNSRAALVRGADRVPEGGHLIVLCSLRPTAHRIPNPLGPVPPTERYADAIASLLAAVPTTLPARATHEIRLVAGSPSAALAETAQRYGATEIVIGAREGSVATESEGVADAVATRTRIPVEVVTAHAPPDPAPAPA